MGNGTTSLNLDERREAERRGTGETGAFSVDVRWKGWTKRAARVGGIAALAALPITGVAYKVAQVVEADPVKRVQPAPEPALEGRVGRLEARAEAAEALAEERNRTMDKRFDSIDASLSYLIRVVERAQGREEAGRRR